MLKIFLGIILITGGLYSGQKVDNFEQDQAEYEQLSRTAVDEGMILIRRSDHEFYFNKDYKRANELWKEAEAQFALSSDFEDQEKEAYHKEKMYRTMSYAGIGLGMALIVSGGSDQAKKKKALAEKITITPDRITYNIKF